MVQYQGSTQNELHTDKTDKVYKIIAIERADDSDYWPAVMRITEGGRGEI